MVSTKTSIEIDKSKCKVCVACAQVCPNSIYSLNSKHIEINTQRQHLCISCGQCMAACENKAIQVGSLDYATDFVEFSDVAENNAFEQLVQNRRSVRSFKNQAVPEELLLSVLNSVAYAPVSFPPHKTELSVVQNKKILAQASAEMLKFYEKMPKLLANPFIRQLIKHKLSETQFRVLQNHVMPIVQTKLANKISDHEDFIIRNAPVLLLFHANTKAELIETDIHIALTYAMLSAHALGIGTCVIDLVAPPVNKNADLKKLLGIPAENQVFSALILGYPKVKYFRSIKRNFAFNFIGEA